MRKILILTLFFVTLLPLLPWFGSATVHAQGIANENYYICSINGFIQMSLYPCSEGHEIEVIKCKKCGKQYMNYETHECSAADDKIQCPHCGKMLTPEENATHNCLNNGDGDDGNSEGNDGNGNVDGGWLPGVSVPGSRPGYGSGNNSGGNEDIFYGGMGGGGSGETGDTTNEINDATKACLESISNRNDSLKAIVNKLQNEGRIKNKQGERTYYDPKEKILYIGSEPTVDKVLHEINHYLQDEENKLSYDKNSINNEYEVAWIVAICEYLQNNGAYSANVLGLTEEEQTKMYFYLEEQTDWSNGTVGITKDVFFETLSKFAKGHEKIFSEKWRKKLKGNPQRDEYWHSIDKNYQYDWQKKIKQLGY